MVTIRECWLILVFLLSSILQWAVIIVLVRRVYGNRLEFRWQTTFFGKTRHGFTVTLWERQRHLRGNNYGKQIFRFSWRSPDTIPDRPYIKDAAKWALPQWRLS